MKTTVSVKGFSDLEKSLREIGSQATKRNIAIRSLTKSAEPMRAEAERLARKDSGDLKKSIAIAPRSISGARKSRRGGGGGAFGDVVEVFIGIDLSVNLALNVYAQIEELGNERQAASPFLRPAFERKGRQTINLLRDSLALEIEKTKQRAARKAERAAKK